MNRDGKIIVIFIVTFFIPFSTFGDNEINTGLFNNIAVSAYDTVSYFTEGMAVKGKKEFKINYKGVQWYFKNQENLDIFQIEPEKYIPQYGGYCAWAIAQGYTANGNPKYWDIVNGKLYLNYNESIQRKWRKNIEGFIKIANKNWPDVIQ